MVAYAGQRIHSILNAPSNENGSRTFWYNSNFGTAPYTPGGPAMMSSPLHMLLDAHPPVAELTGRRRKEKSTYGPDNGKEIDAVELKILIVDSGLLRQCAYCLDWEGEGRMKRFEQCGDDVYWCDDVSQHFLNRMF